MATAKKILVVYYWTRPVMRETVKNHLYCFTKYSTHEVYYLNLAYQSVPQIINDNTFDLVIFHTTFAAFRNSREYNIFDLPELEKIDTPKIILPQDEYLRSQQLNDFVNQFAVSHIFTISPESEWEKIYPGVNFNRVRISEVLAGYLDDGMVSEFAELKKNQQQRTIDIGYRARENSFSLGRHSRLKVAVGDIFREKAPTLGLNTDIATGESGTKFGKAWYQFLVQCKYFPGVEGGASLLDSDGSIMEKTGKYLKENPGADFEQVEAACFPGKDGNLKYYQVSPRHLEACAAGTCQVLIEGQYNGILLKGHHYIEVKKDFSNIREVLEIIREDRVREKIVSNAYNDIVSTGKYTYRKFVEEIFQISL
jgi:hypothetical protein